MEVKVVTTSLDSCVILFTRLNIRITRGPYMCPVDVPFFNEGAVYMAVSSLKIRVTLKLETCSCVFVLLHKTF